MKSKTESISLWLCLLTVLPLVACGPAENASSPPDSPTAAATTVVSGEPPTLDELARGSFAGIMEEPVQLTDGSWEGEPFVEGAASAPAVGLVDRFHLTGDVTGDDREEAVVLLWSSSGGSGTFDYLAVTGRAAEGVVNLATAELGDRVQVRRGRLNEGRIELDVVEAGPEDAACCPSQLATRVWRLESAGLIEIEQQVTGKLSLAELQGPEWVLTDLAWNEPAPPEPEVTLRIEEEQVVGKAGCNGFFGSIEESGDTAAGITVGPLGATRMMCPEEIMATEDRFLRQLAGATSYSFLAGNLALSWQVEQDAGVMIFRPRDPAAADS